MKETVLQIRQSTSGLMESSNQFIQSFSRDHYHRVVVYLKGTLPPDAEQKIVADEVIFLDLPDEALNGLIPTATPKLLKIFKSYRPSILLAHRYKSIYLTGIISLLYKVPLSFAILHGNGQLDRAGRRLFCRLVLSRRFYFIGVSEVVRQDLLAAGADISPNRVFSTPNSIDIRALQTSLMTKAEARKALCLESEDFVIGQIARLSPTKNQKLLLNAFSGVLDIIPNARLVIIGGGRLNDELQTQARELGIADVVKFTGHLDSAANLLPAFDLFVMTSKDEGFGRVLLEAMTADCPIIASEIPAFSEVLSGSGTLFPSDNCDSLIKQIQSHHQMPQEERADFVAQQRKVLETFYSLEGFKTRFSSLVGSLQQTHPEELPYAKPHRNSPL